MSSKFKCIAHSFICILFLQVTEASSSVAMESQGCRRDLNHLIFNEELDIDLITTDRAPSVRKIMREEFQMIHHEFDPWHVAKGK